MNGYSVRRTRNYSQRDDGTWKGHSDSLCDERGYTRKWPTIEAAEQAAREWMNNITDPTAENFIRYCKIYNGKECIKVINRS